ncbi:MAG: hypothetical protein SCALA702_08950 [Melioribacteraceae bacterium]|nr:MAG: hypothetical protein SCALA702_08950 [Melioribacteraceae bacterium]
MEDLVGVIVDNYKIVSTLGKGGMGIVYKGYDTKLDREVAIKMMSSKMFENERNIERFKREAKNQAKMLHQNIVTVYGFIEYSDLLGIVMEYVEGESLEKVIYRQKKFSLFDTVYIMRQIFSGLHLAHNKGFVHRDIKPSNIILNNEGISKIMDFGISKSASDKRFTKTGSKIGTVYYMSPEQINGEEVTHLSDIYSLGCTIYEMLSGVPPFYYKSEYEIMDAHMNKMPTPLSQLIPGMPPLVDDIVFRAMSKNPYDRYNSCEEFSRALDHIEKYIEDVKIQSAKREESKKTKTKTFSLFGVVGFVVVILIVSFLILNQAKDLLQSGKIEEFDREHNIQSMFNDNKVGEDVKVSKRYTGVYNELNSIQILRNNNAFITADSGLILKSTNGGQSWDKVRLPGKNILYDSFFFGSGRGFIVGDGSYCISTIDYLRNFEKINMPPGYTLLNVEFIDTKVGFITGSLGLVMRTLDGGMTWERIRVETSQNLYDIAFADKKTGYIVGWDGVILKTTNLGQSWESLPKFTNKYLKSIDFLDDDTGVIVGGGGTIYKTNNGGSRWNEIKPPQVASFQSVKFINDDLALITANKGLILRSKDDGTTWRVIKSGVYTNLNDIAVTSGNQVYVVGVNGTILKLF